MYFCLAIAFSGVFLLNNLSGANGENCFEVTTGIDYSQNKNDMKHFDGQTLGTCCDLCKTTTGCTAYVFDTADNKCYLKNGYANGVANKRTISGFPTLANARYAGYGGSQGCYAVTTGIDYSNNKNDMKNIKGQTLELCCDQCKATTGCTAYVFDTTDQTCYLKNGYSNAIANKKTISGFPTESNARYAGYGSLEPVYVPVSVETTTARYYA